MTKQELITELEASRKEIEGLKTNQSSFDEEKQTFQDANDQLSAVFDGFNEIVYVSDPDTYEILYVNKPVEDVFGDVAGKICYKVFQGFDEPCSFCTNDKIFGEYAGKAYIWEFQNTINKNWYRCIDKAIPWTSGKKVRIEIAIDVTDLKKYEQELEMQNRTIMELSTPVIQVWEGVVVAPLIGTLDSGRTQQFMERLLEVIVKTKSPVALVDITGVPTIDTKTAQHIIESITSAQLLGTQVVLTGVSPSIAQTLVHLGIDLSGMETRSSLAAGFQVALDFLGMKIIQKAKGANNGR
jgi:anti-anti-sigma regulatory factor